MTIRRNLILLLVGGLMLAGLPGCIAPRTELLMGAPGNLPPRAEVESVPFFPQDRYYCGPSSLAMVLAWGGMPVTPDDLVAQVYTPGREGTFAADIVAAARRNGRIAVEIHELDDLLAEIAAGHPTIVFQNLALSWFPQWHFAVAIGYDLSERQLILRSGTERRLVMSLDNFEHTWNRTGRWALVVLPPEQAPVSPDLDAWLRAAAGLEQAARPQDALTAYRSILTSRPDNLPARMGEANALFALNDFRGSEESYRRVLSADPMMGAAWNNLAHALYRQGRRDDAIAAARRAVSLGNDPDGVYSDTLREVSQPR